MRFPRKFPDAQHRGGGEGISRAGNPACAKSSGGRSRCATRGGRGKLPLRVRRGGRLYAPPCRLHGGSNAGLGAGMLFSFSGCRICRDPPAAVPPAGKFPMRTERVRRACRNTGGGAGRRPIGDQMEGRGGVRDRPVAIVRGVRMLVRMRGTRRARYLQTLPQPYSYAAYPTQIFSTAAILLRRICYCRICYCRICLCRYCVGHNATAAYLLHIMTVAYTATAEYSTVDILYCSYTHITYSQRPPHSPHPLLTQS